MRRIHMILFSIWLVLVMLVISSIVMSGNADATDHIDKDFIEVTVEEEHTLWDIASHFGPYNNTQENVYIIMQINHLSSPVIYPGEVLKIPVQ